MQGQGSQFHSTHEFSMNHYRGTLQLEQTDNQSFSALPVVYSEVVICLQDMDMCSDKHTMLCCCCLQVLKTMTFWLSSTNLIVFDMLSLACSTEFDLSCESFVIHSLGNYEKVF